MAIYEIYTLIACGCGELYMHVHVHIYVPCDSFFSKWLCTLCVNICSCKVHKYTCIYLWVIYIICISS